MDAQKNWGVWAVGLSINGRQISESTWLCGDDGQPIRSDTEEEARKVAMGAVFQYGRPFVPQKFETEDKSA